MLRDGLASPLHPPVLRLTDAVGRVISYLRLSVTDRCNLRCFYCMCDEVKFLPKAEVLTLEEIERLSAVFIGLGISKLRLTGGEPLARPGVVDLIARLGRHLQSGALQELTLTTNGTLLSRYAQSLTDAGVKRVNVSLDTLSPSTFHAITGHDGLHQVLAGIDAARAAGLAVRINTVAMAGVNEDEFDRLLSWCGAQGCDMALIELMPMGAARHTRNNALLLDTVRQRLEQHWHLTPLAQTGSGPAQYMLVAETGRRLGFITPMSHGFCHSCNRVRLTCIGDLMLCLGHEGGVDLRRLLRQGGADSENAVAIVAALRDKPRTQHFTQGDALPLPSPKMWQMGG